MGKVVSQAATRKGRALLAFAAAFLATAALGVSSAAADVGKVLIFNGTAGTPNSSSGAATTAISNLATAADLTADVTNDATKISAANLAGYRAVVFVDSAGDVLNDAQEADLQSYVQTGGGFVGVGETAKLEEGKGFFDTLIGLTGASRTTGTASSSQDVEFLDRVNPATRNEPLLLKSHPDAYYTWTNNPTGLVHTVARVRFNALPDGTSVTNDAVQRFTGSTDTKQPQLERAVSWCRDIQQGRSFYTGLGQTADAWSGDALSKQMTGALEWAAGMVRGNCKATINSNYVATRLTPPNPSNSSNQFTGELTNSYIADDGRVFYTGRAVCNAGMTQITNWAQPNVALGCGTIHVWDPRGSGTDPSPAKVAKVGELQVFGAKGGGAESGNTSKDEQGLLAFSLDPKFTKGRPYFYIQYFPYYAGEQGYNTTPLVAGGGFDRPSFTGERRLSRFTYDDATKSIVPGSEKVIMTWRTQVYSCCHVGASMAWDSAGNLYVTNGDNTGNSPNSNNGGYTNSDPAFTIPCPGGAVGAACGVTNPCPAFPAKGSMAACGYTSFSDARQTSGNSNTYEGKMIRIHPLDDPGSTPGAGSTYSIPGDGSPNGPNLFPPDGQAVKDGLAKPEIFAMGVRNDYTIHIDPKTDKITTAWVGPDQGTDSTTWGPAKTENATIMNAAGNYGWPYCQAGNRFDYRAKLPSATGGGQAAPLGTPGTVGGGADGTDGGWWDCSKPLLNESPYNNGIETIPAPKPTNIWYGPQGGCYDYQRNANGAPIMSSDNNTPAPGTYRRCPFIIGGSQAPIDGGIYRKPAGDHPQAWPAYWDGRWFLGDFSSANNVRHAMLMDPDTEFKGGQPVAADSLLGIIPSSLFGGSRVITMNFGPDGDLYVGSYSGGFFTVSNNNTGVWRFSYVGGADTPGPDPTATPSANSSLVSFGIGKSGGVSYAWKFDDGGTAEGANVNHAFLTGGAHTATLTVTYADGETASKDVTVDVPPTAPGTVTGTVPATLSLTLGSSASFGAFTPAQAKTYAASTTANVLSTAGDATLSVADPSTTAPGHLVNGTFAMAQALKAGATDAAHPNATFGDVSANPLTLLSYTGPTTNDAVTVQFQQPIAANDPLRTGSYTKTLTFTLSTTNP